MSMKTDENLELERIDANWSSLKFYAIVVRCTWRLKLKIQKNI